ncbi:hypothetical protein SUGI_0797860 [Cryptomeria japonica]|nr:hypothetical protein SUGI_0797860 [Cryptomeria japonica]
MVPPLHAVIVACPAQGHFNPIMNLAQLLAMRGFFITFVTTEWMDQRLLKAAYKDAAARDHKSVPPITCIISDSFLSCTAEVAKTLGVPRVIFWTTCTAYAIIQKNANFLLSLGHIPVKEEDLKSKDKLITCLPGKIPPIRPTDIELEGGKDAQMGLSVNGCPALAIGPLFLPNFLQGRNSVYSMWEEDKTCFQWLDCQAQGSVLYVSFGSIAIKSEKQLNELALGLEACGYPFLWKVP